MPTPSPPNSISAWQVIEEAGKVSHFARIAATEENRAFSPYPTPAVRSFKDLYFTRPEVDMNRQKGRVLDTGEIGLPWWYDWDTWKPPEIKFMWFHQFDEDRGIRAAVGLRGGDPWRTLVRFSIVRDVADLSQGETIANSDVRFATEFNDDAQNPRSVRYSNVGDAGQAATTNDWTSVDDFGDYQRGNQEPGATNFPDPGAAEIGPEVIMTWVDHDNPGPNGADSIDNQATYYLIVQLFDGRYNDTLGSDPLNDDYSLDASNTGATAGPALNCTDQEPLYDPAYSYFDSAAGDGGIILYDGLGGLTTLQIGNESLTVEVDNFYRYYLQGDNVFVWVYVTDDTNNLDQPYFPDDFEGGDPVGAPANHPYSTRTGDDFDYTVFELNKWVRFENMPVNITGLSFGTEYTVFVAPYRETDIDSYTAFAQPFSAPENTQIDQNIVEVTEITSTNKLLEPVIDGGSRTSNKFVLDWIDPNGADADGYNIKYAEKPSGPDPPIVWDDEPVNDGQWLVESDWGTSTTDRNNNEFRTNELATIQSTWLVRIQATSTGAKLNSPYSEVFEITFN